MKALAIGMMSFVIIAGPASAKLSANGEQLNKLATNGLHLNRITANGIQLNRITQNGIEANRLSANKLAVNTSLVAGFVGKDGRADEIGSVELIGVELPR